MKPFTSSFSINADAVWYNQALYSSSSALESFFGHNLAASSKYSVTLSSFLATIKESLLSNNTFNLGFTSFEPLTVTLFWLCCSIFKASSAPVSSAPKALSGIFPSSLLRSASLNARICLFISIISNNLFL